jgi:hypothetical protein
LKKKHFITQEYCTKQADKKNLLEVDRRPADHVGGGDVKKK